MKKFFLLLPILVMLYACETGAGGGGQQAADLSTTQDSMYYAFGSSIVKGMNVEGVPWNGERFGAGVKELMGGAASLDAMAAMQAIQAFGGEVQARQGRPITAEDGLTANMDETSYAYGVYMAQQMSDIGLDVKADAMIAGFTDAANGTNALGDEATLQRLTQVFTDEANEKARAKQEADNAEAAATSKAEGAAFMAENKGKEGVIVHESGMQYKVLKTGDANGASPAVTDKVTIHYTGRLLDGTVFDSSEKTPESEPVTFPLSNLIKGWQIALPMMKPGEKWTIWLPADIGYGNAGSPPRIPPGATLEFDIEYFGIGE